MSKSAPIRDVVCGMEIDPLTTVETSDYNRTTYYFCTSGCKQKFDHAPHLYAAGPTINPVAHGATSK